MDFNERTIKVLGESNVKSLENKKIIVFGCGGVGGFVIEFLTRMGIGNIDIVDFDKISISNINRQIVALEDTIGLYKVDVMKKRMEAINPNIKTNAVKEKITSLNISDFNLSGYDFVVDAIDIIEDKLALILEAKNEGVKIISAMGAGNKTAVPDFKVVDIYKTEGDGLAKKMRKLLKSKGVDKLDVVASKEVSFKTKNGVGSVVYQVANCASIIAGYVVNKLI